MSGSGRFCCSSVYKNPRNVDQKKGHVGFSIQSREHDTHNHNMQVLIVMIITKTITPYADLIVMVTIAPYADPRELDPHKRKP